MVENMIPFSLEDLQYIHNSMWLMIMMDDDDKCDNSNDNCDD